MEAPTSSENDGSAGEYPGTYGEKKTIDYNGLKIALVGNDPEALSADHNFQKQESITPISGRIVTGPLANPHG